MRLVAAIVLLIAGAEALGAQRLSPLLEVMGTVQDSGGVVVPGVYVIAQGLDFPGHADSAGRFRVRARLPLESVDVVCLDSTNQWRNGITVPVSAERLDSGTVSAGVVIIPPGLCTRSGRMGPIEVRGIHQYDFEFSNFGICRTADGPQPSWRGRRMSLEFAPGWTSRSPVKWPDRIPGEPWMTAFVHAIGHVEGPGRFHHFGSASYRFVVDSVIEVRKPRSVDCK